VRLSRPAARVALVGLGGVGKSQLAIEYAHVLRSRSPETWILWIYASNEARFEQSVRSVLDQLKVRGRKDPGANMFQLLRFWLSDVTRGPWLIILDNADDSRVLLGSPSASEASEKSVVGEARLDYIPRCNHGRVLVTSRTKESAKQLVYWNDIITVEPMEEDQALALLRNKLGVRHTEQRIAQLARELDFMPLALTQAAAYICQSEGMCSIQQYLEKLGQCDKTGANVLDMDKGDLRRDRESSNSIMLTWQISFDHIRETHPSAADLLSLMSFFDRHAIPQALLHEKRSTTADRELGRGGKTPVASTVAGGERHETNVDSVVAGAVRECVISVDGPETAEEFERDYVVLRNYSFVSLTADTTTFQMHRLVQSATKKWLSSSRGLERWGSQFISNLNEAFPAGTFENRELCRSLFPHAMAVLHTEVEDRKAVLLQASLLLRSGQFAATIGAYPAAEEMHKQSLEIRSKVLGEDHPSTLISMNNLTGTYSYQGRHEKAEGLSKITIEKRKEVLGEEHPDTLSSMGHLANTYYRRGMYNEAEMLQVDVTRLKKKVLGEGHLDTVTSMDSLALTYAQQGKGEDAEDLQMEVVARRTKLLGEGHPHTLTCMNNLAGIYLTQGRLEKAEELQTKVMEKEREVLGDHHPNTLTSEGNLAWIYMKQGRLEETERLEREVIRKRKEVLGEGHPDTLVSMSTLAYMLRALGRRRSALNLMSSCALKSPDVLGVDHYNAKAYWRVKAQWEREDSFQAEAVEFCSTSDESIAGRAKITRALRSVFASRTRKNASRQAM
jgi:tetratricopeptide (TPR) repeat protein